VRHLGAFVLTASASYRLGNLIEQLRLVAAIPLERMLVYRQAFLVLDESWRRITPHWRI